ncbi:phospholipase A2 [Streptomyces caniscabiei]|uniref:phospholipase A2 n=1 Tax=Streptomyces caniscabiei TaxID=2746961 RepID=UPI000A3B08B4|nr:phospholipase A2 [Streptomyces caniscabiei]
MKTRVRTVLPALLATAVTALGVGEALPAVAAPAAVVRTAPSLRTVAAAAPAEDVRQVADRIMNLRYYDFTKHPKVAPFNWANDGCSGPQEIKNLFTEACNQHDFGYRNYGAQAGGLRLSPIRQTKDWIDTRFWHEMRQTCFDHHGGGNWCLIHARAAYLAVHNFGDRFFWAA